MLRKPLPLCVFVLLAAFPAIAAKPEAESLADRYARSSDIAQSDKLAVALYRKAASEGRASAQGKLGAMIANCRGTPCDDKEAVAWLRRAAEAGDASAEFNLGVMYADGRGVPSDQTLSLEWREKAADHGLIVAMRDVGALLLDTSEQNDQDRALSYLEKTADAGNNDSAYRAGHFLARRSYCGHEERNRYLRASIPYLEKAASGGDSRASNDLAELYSNFTTPLFDQSKSDSWRKKASDDGSAYASFWLAMASQSVGADPNDARRIALFEKAAQRGYADAALALSKIYAGFDAKNQIRWSKEYDRLIKLADKTGGISDDYKRNQRVVLDENQTFNWYRQAATKRNTAAVYNLGIVYLSGLDTAIDDRKAVALLAAAAAKGFAQAEFVLAKVYEDGRHDQVRAMAFYEKAARKGLVLAQLRLGELPGHEGFGWLLKAARQGSVEAAFLVGKDFWNEEDCDRRGRVPVCDLTLATKWLTIAADDGDSRAQEVLATRHGVDSSEHSLRVIPLLLRASKSGSGQAADDLAWLYKYNPFVRDPAKELEFLKLAAERHMGTDGKVAAIYEAAGDLPQAFHWYMRAGDGDKVGRAFEFGVGVAKDPQKSRLWYLKAAQAGDGDAQYRLGRLYADGIGGERDLSLAYALFTFASIGGGSIQGARPEPALSQAAAAARSALVARLNPTEKARALAISSSWHPASPFPGAPDANGLDQDGLVTERYQRREARALACSR